MFVIPCAVADKRSVGVVADIVCSVLYVHGVNVQHACRTLCDRAQLVTPVAQAQAVNGGIGVVLTQAVVYEARNIAVGVITDGLVIMTQRCGKITLAVGAIGEAAKTVVGVLVALVRTVSALPCQ